MVIVTIDVQSNKKYINNKIQLKEMKKKHKTKTKRKRSESREEKEKKAKQSQTLFSKSPKISI